MEIMIEVYKPDPLVHELFEMERMFTQNSARSRSLWYMGRQLGTLVPMKTANFKDVRP